MKKFNKLPPLDANGIRNRVVENCRREGKFAFAPTAMATAFVEAVVR